MAKIALYNGAGSVWVDSFLCPVDGWYQVVLHSPGNGQPAEVEIVRSGDAAGLSTWFQVYAVDSGGTSAVDATGGFIGDTAAGLVGRVPDGIRRRLFLLRLWLGSGDRIRSGEVIQSAAYLGPHDISVDMAYSA